MLVRNLSKQAVNPYALAVRTQRQRGGLSGLGLALDTVAAVDPEPYSKAALTFIATIENFLHIGAGRQEADQIVPKQNQLVEQVIAPISDAVSGAYATRWTPSQLRSMSNSLQQAEYAWLKFLHETNWSDGRAATQAEATLAPYFDGLEAKIQFLLQTAPTSAVGDALDWLSPTGPVPPTLTLPGYPTAPIPPGGVTQAGMGLLPIVGIAVLGFVLVMSKSKTRRG